MRVHPLVFGLLVISVFFGVIWTFQAVGIWSTSGKVDASGAAVLPNAADPNSIKGWMTLEQISSIYQVPIVELLATFGLPEGTSPETPIKDLESDTFETSTLRTWLQNRIDQKSTTISETIPTVTALPDAEISVQVTATQPSANVQTTHEVIAGIITGKTTFQEVLDWGISAETISAILDGELPPPTTVIKDYVIEKGFEFSTIKTRLQEEIDKQ